MRVWLITVGEPLPLPGESEKLIRTGRLAEYLGAKGHEVVWWTSTFDHFHKRQHDFDGDRFPWRQGVQLELLRAPSYASNASVRRLWHQRVTAWRFARRAQRAPRPDVILCSYPTIELSSAAASYAARYGSRLALDVRDLWPDIFVEAMPRWVRPFGAPAIWAYDLEARRTMRSADGLVAVSAGYLNWALRKAGRNRRPGADAVFPIGFARPRVDEAEVERARERLTGRGVRFDQTLVIFVGSFGRTYDLSTVIQAARELQGPLPGVQFVLAGDGENGTIWRSEASGLGNVVFPGWLEQHELVALNRAASVGLQSYAPGAPQGLANKLFEYLGYGLALVSSLEGENAALLEAHGCGLSYVAGDAAGLAGALRALLASSSDLARAKQNAFRLFESEFEVDRIHQGIEAYLSELARAS
jgi:glycosyltransferase involved in cell wall biosynthesis